jgi:hypothetical protein
MLLAEALGCLVACSLALAACSPGSPSLSQRAAAPQGTTATSETVAPGAWRAQAIRLAGALRDVEGSVISPPEPSSETSPSGTFAARVVDVQPDETIVLDRQRLYIGNEAYLQAKRAGAKTETGLFAVNSHQERLPVPVAPDAGFVVWYPGETALNVSSPDVAAMSALSPREFVRLYRSNAAKRASLGSWGGWATVVGGKLTSFVEVNSP